MVTLSSNPSLAPKEDEIQVVLIKLFDYMRGTSTSEKASQTTPKS